MATPKQLLEKVHDLENLRRGYVNMKASAITVANVSFYDRTKEYMENRLASFNEQLRSFIYEHEHSDEIIYKCDNKIERLNKEINLIKSNKEIAKLLKLQQQIDELRKEAT